MPLTCPGVPRLPSSASSLTEESPFLLLPPSHYGLQLKSLGVSVEGDHWKGKSQPVQNTSKRQVNSMRSFYSINVPGTLTTCWLFCNTEPSNSQELII